jgi:hypothetical protein
VNAADLIRPLTAGRPGEWHGLAAIPVAGFDAALGPPADVAQAELGYYPAERRDYGGAVVWARKGQAVMVEVACDLPAAALDGLEEPCAVLPNEILLADGYPHERLFCRRGLVATVVQPYAGGEKRILRLRGIAPIAGPAEFGPELYRAFEDQAHLGGAP